MPAHVRAALARGLATEPSARWPSLDALLAELERDPAARRRRIAAVGGVGALALVAGYALVTRGGDPRAACDAAAARIDAAWMPLDAKLVAARFAGSHRAHAGATLERVHGALDGYAKDWADLRRDVCLATAVRNELTPRTSELEVACLDRLAGGMRALVTVLEREGDAATLDRAAAAIGQLRAPSECREVQALDAIPPPPAELRARVAELQADHDRVEAEFRAGRYKALQPLARANAKAADEVGYAPAQAEAMMSLAMLEGTLHDDEGAERDDEQAVTYAGVAHDDHVMNVAWRGLVAEAIARSHFDEAAERLRYAQAALARSGNAPLYDARLEATHATLLLAKGDAAGALATIDHAVQIAERGSLAPLERAALLNTRGRILVQLHRGADAIVAFGAAKSIWESVLGPDEPNIAGVLLNISNAESNLGRYDDAERDLDRSAQMTEDEFGPNALNLGRVLNNRCEVRLLRHDVTGASADCERALAIKTKASGPNSAELASTLMELAELAEQRDDEAAADEIRARIVAIHVGALGAHHPKVAQDYYDLAESALRAGDATKARDDVGHGRAIAEAAHDPTLVAEGQSALADVLRVRGDIAAARAAIRLALAHHEELAHGSANADVALAVASDHEEAGRIEQAAGDLVAAERELRLAVELTTPVAGTGQANLAAPLEHLGALLAAAGKPHDAVAPLDRALAIATATAGPATDRARLGLALASARWADADRAGALAAAHAAQAAVTAAHDTPSIIRARADAAAWLAAHR
jgi:tetratricopeptide (TPR) repeat protein